MLEFHMRSPSVGIELPSQSLSPPSSKDSSVLDHCVFGGDDGLLCFAGT